MKVTTDPKGMTLLQRKKAAAIGLIHSIKHWSVKKKVYPTKWGNFAVRCNKTIIVKLECKR